MKKMIMMGGNEIIISDDELENISALPDNTRFVKLRDGSLVNMSSISCVVDFKGIPFLCETDPFGEKTHERRLYKAKDESMYYVGSDRSRVTIPFEDFHLIEYAPPEQVDAFLEERNKEHKIYLKEIEERKKRDTEERRKEEEKFIEEKLKWENLPKEEKKLILNKKIDAINEEKKKRDEKWYLKFKDSEISKIQNEIDNLK